MGAQPEQQTEPTDEQVTWIGRDRAAISSGTAPYQTTSGENSDTTLPPLPTRWVALGIGLGLAAVALVIVAVVRAHSAAAGSGATLSEGAIPLVTVLSPGTRTVTSTVDFNGTIGARFDMPIGTEGETGRISGVYVEAGDRVRSGQVLARSRYWVDGPNR